MVAKDAAGRAVIPGQVRAHDANSHGRGLLGVLGPHEKAEVIWQVVIAVAEAFVGASCDGTTAAVAASMYVTSLKDAARA